jgi:putative sigma-54 modulation protein
MRITITGRNLEISDGWRAKIEKKVGKLDKYLRDDSEVQVRLTQEHGTRNTAELTILLAGTMLRAEETGPEMSACLDKVMDKIVRQIHRYRTRIEKRLRTDAFEVEAPEPAAEPVEEVEAHKVVRVKRFSVKPVSVEDAITQMEMLGHSFHLFLNEETETFSVVYRRENGDYGLLEPTNK